MTPAARKTALTTHVITSVGWLGAVGAFLVLGIAGLASANVDVVRGAYMSMNLVGLFMIVPMSLASFASGILLALGTEWGLRRYYWVLTKLVLSLFATVLLLLHQFTAVAGASRRVLATAPTAMPELGQTGTQLVGDAAFGLLVLMVITALSVFKPWGRTASWQRQQLRQQYGTARSAAASASALAPDHLDPKRESRAALPALKRVADRVGGLPMGLGVFMVIIAVMVLTFVAMHIVRGGPALHSR